MAASSSGSTSCSRSSRASSSYSTTTEVPDTDSESETDSESDAVPSLLDRLRSPSPSDFARKRKTAANPPPRGKRKSRGAVDLKKIKPEQRVRDYPSEPLTVSNGKLFCRGCREELCLKSSSIKNHLKSNKHQEGKVKLSKKEAREKDIAEALVQYNSDNHLRGETLPQSQQVYRVKVVKTFLQAGVPLSKLNIFRDLLEENGYRLSDRRFMFDLIPFILKEEKLKEELKGKHLGVVFDGTTRLGEAIAIIVHFVSESWTIEQRLIRIQLLSKNMSGEEIARELVLVLSTNYGISPDHLIASMRDRASANNVAMRTMAIVYPKVLDVGCFSHTLDRVGEHFKTPTLSEFCTSWISLFSHSPNAKLLWREQTGRAIVSYSATRWWSKWEVYNQMLLQFADIQSFLEKNDIGKATRKKLISLLQDSQKLVVLKIELATIVDWGEPFVKATYNLEGDGPLAFTCFDIVQSVTAAIHVANTPNVNAVVRSLTSSPAVNQQLTAYARACVQPGLDYFEQQLQTSLKAPLSAFKAARMFSPSKVTSLNPSASELDSLLAFPFFSATSDLEGLKGELATYLATAEGVDVTLDPVEWWRKNATLLPAWAAAAKKVLAVQPSSGAAERAFSLLNSTFSDQQDNSLKDYIETSVMLRYNRQPM